MAQFPQYRLDILPSLKTELIGSYNQVLGRLKKELLPNTFLESSKLAAAEKFISLKEIFKKSKDCNWTRTQNHLVRKRTLSRLLRARSSLTFMQLWSVDSL